MVSSTLLLTLLITLLTVSNNVWLTCAHPYAIGVPVDYDGWNLYWEDEFNATHIDTNVWTLTNYTPGDAQLQFYTPENCFIEDGKLVLLSNYSKLYGFNYTSCRMDTSGSLNVVYGRFEALMQLPLGKGYWPAFWLYSLESTCDFYREIDIMENTGDDKIIWGTYHETNNCSNMGSVYNTTDVSTLNTEFHLYSVIWDVDLIVFMVDNIPYNILDLKNNPTTRFPNDVTFYMILNTAIGGGWPGDPDKNSVFPQKNIVEYVKIWKQQQ
ncbi:hypothetical protein SAMD00019534_116990 [Acytostelium subglobosum LB1]|uniref:hypothetical protein n=1 Tax=Acytostelium subglobosum LB1 TaxID=1410327 RepID=UPI0006452321|nr:hypothetical protein SAMD00019534_116990 [Acytostelium subglobosum LB1]GAM28523.1 hypothetical protein SAMD00019534_116990 [Acytostelium subglobosum LB1]|eukprot:XP_012748562.1 hypothetical protein SAMD00019534_116990 [Acytostelium subglobosum LB1]